MSQRQFIRRSPLGPSTSAFPEEYATLRTSADTNDNSSTLPGSSLPISPLASTFSSNNSHWQQPKWTEEQDALPLSSNSQHHASAMSRRVTLWDVVRDAIRLTRARRTYFLVFIPMFAFPLLLMLGICKYLLPIAKSHGQGVFKGSAYCEKMILAPWFEATVTKNLSSSQQEEFFTQFQLNCSMFKVPAERIGYYLFSNGSITWESSPGFSRAAIIPAAGHASAVSLAYLFVKLWATWGLVAVAWGLHVATTITTATSRTRELRREAISFTKLMGLVRVQFSYAILRGIIRVLFTDVLAMILTESADFFRNMPIIFLVRRSRALQQILTQEVLASPAWTVVNPLRILFVLSETAAALEPGVWGFKALLRGIQVTRGNRWKSAATFLLLFLESWLCSYLIGVLITMPWPAANVPVQKFLFGTMVAGTFRVAELLPQFFLLPVFYFKCKAWRERVSSMA